MVALGGDRLDFVVGKKAADQLEQHFGLRTVADLVRYFPRKYSDAMTTRGEGGEELDLEEGEHVTFVDEITKPRPGLPTARRSVSTW